MNKNQPTQLTIREKITMHLVIFLIQMINPWEFSHQYDKYWNELKELMDIKVPPQTK